MDIWLMSLVLAAQLAGGPSVQRVFKCMDAGNTLYQSTPCTGRQVASWEVRTESVDPEVERKLEQLRAELGARRAVDAATSRSARGPRSREEKRASASACERARAGREAAFRKAGHKRGFELSSRWDNAVHDACR